MSRRKRPGPVKRGPSESLMEFFVRNRSATDAQIDVDVKRSCESKAGYKSEGEAKAIALMNGMKLFTYHCRYCEFWHLTRRPTPLGVHPEIIDE
jgi:hypothetical protein